MTQSKDPVGEMSFAVQTPIGFSGVRPVAASTGDGVLALAASSVSPNFGRGVASTPPASGSGSGQFCTHCNRANHTTQTCYKLHGFPEGWSRGGRRGRGRGNIKSQHGGGAQAGGAGGFVPNVAAANTMMASPVPGAGADGGHSSSTPLPPSSSIVDSPPIIDDDDLTAIVGSTPATSSISVASDSSATSDSPAASDTPAFIYLCAACVQPPNRRRRLPLRQIKRDSRMGDVSSGKHKRKGEDNYCKTTNKKWTPEEDMALIASLAELCDSGWKRKNGIFKNGYTAALERKLKLKLPGCNIKASPHIESRLKLLRRQYEAIREMQGADGIQWVEQDNMVLCRDDKVWEDWIQAHADARGLRNKQFPYYNDLHLLFGKRGTTDGINDEADGDKVFNDDDSNVVTDLLMVDHSLEEDDLQNYDSNAMVNNNGTAVKCADSLIKHYKKRRRQIDVIRNVSNCNHLPDPVEESHPSEDSNSTRTNNNNNINNNNRINEENLSADDIIRAQIQIRGSTIRASDKKNCKQEGGSSELDSLAKIFGTFLEKYDKHLSLLGQIVGRERAAENMAAERRVKLNGELKKLPNLNLQARLRAASLMVNDSARLDLFYSLSEEEKNEWFAVAPIDISDLAGAVVPQLGHVSKSEPELLLQWSNWPLWLVYVSGLVCMLGPENVVLHW
ncbi:Unknown protein [Striga hermonthica]|uniref:Myb/SANT-like domain-containing protein n=1 Tax=Striga hermonthica TaxID=68872 RepID=A0A9N7MVP1_STRHE|nr:Unknown protein [Striga hermonthica]